jgi:hypothetical protein
METSLVEYKEAIVTVNQVYTDLLSSYNASVKNIPISTQDPKALTKATQKLSDLSIFKIPPKEGIPLKEAGLLFVKEEHIPLNINLVPFIDTQGSEFEDYFEGEEYKGDDEEEYEGEVPDTLEKKTIFFDKYLKSKAKLIGTWNQTSDYTSGGNVWVVDILNHSTTNGLSGIKLESPNKDYRMRKGLWYVYYIKREFVEDVVLVHSEYNTASITSSEVETYEFGRDNEMLVATIIEADVAPKLTQTQINVILATPLIEVGQIITPFAITYSTDNGGYIKTISVPSSPEGGGGKEVVVMYLNQ